MSPRRPTSVSPRLLRSLRERAGLTQAELADRTGYSPKTIYRWEAGENPPRDAVIKFLQQRLEAYSEPPSMSSFTFIDLFAGIGGMRHGFEAAGGRCVFTSEIDKFCRKTYRANFSDDHTFADDIVTVASEWIPSFDVLLAGFPCQPFSIAGVSKKNALGRPHGFDCEIQGTLFFEVARILRHHQPRAFLLENVKHLLNHDGGRTFEVILHTLTEDLGYEVYHDVIDAQCVVPQHRERVFLAGFREPVEFSWSSVSLPDASQGPRLQSILHPEDGSEKPESRFTDESGNVLERYILSDKLWTYLQEYAEKHRRRGNGFGYGLVGPEDVARTLSARYYKDGSEILVRRENGNPRRLTPRECARLMGFDRPDRSPVKIPVSDTQAYKQFGNAVVVPVVEAMATAMRPHVIPTERRDPLQLDLALASAANA